MWLPHGATLRLSCLLFLLIHTYPHLLPTNSRSRTLAVSTKYCNSFLTSSYHQLWNFSRGSQGYYWQQLQVPLSADRGRDEDSVNLPR